MRTRSATAAASRYGGRCPESGCRLSHTLTALEMRDGTREQIADLLRREMAVQQSVTRDGDRGGFFRHDQDRGVCLFRQAERGAVARAERLVGHFELCERQHAAGSDDLIAPDENGAVVQR